MKSLYLFIFLILINTSLFSQNNDHYFKFNISDRSEIQTLTKIISIDNVDGNTVYAYANDEEFLQFLMYHYDYEILSTPSLVNPKMSSLPDEIRDWDTYPTYEGYVAMMYLYDSLYPNLCSVINIGSSVQGRALLFAKISDNVSTKEPEPQFMYSSTMHGNETTGYVLMLRLIDYLLTKYGIDPFVTYLVDNMEIWINPLANPDGTYYGGNHTVNNARRYNANNKDLNRNFPDPRVGPYPTGPWQPETIAMMNIASANHFVMSANFHGGIEVINYPWDTWSRLTADNNWWVYVSRQYADTAQANSPSGYMNALNNGITNGYAWYQIAGGRQDYMCYFQRGRECTIELSDVQLLPPSQLPAHWNYNYKSFLNYIRKTLYGITGSVTDSATGHPIEAKVTVLNHDIDSSEVFCDSLFGKYYRLIHGGSYSLQFSAPNYYSKTFTGVVVNNDSTTVLNVQLRSTSSPIVKNENNIPAEFNLLQNYPNPFNPETTIGFDIPKSTFTQLIIFDALGREITTLVNEELNIGSYQTKWNAESYGSGIYYYQLVASDYTETRKMILLK
ncbi:MAG: carboxypeptidase regulatory-like domain-containing protein [Ignavibacteria bacterium]|nr:carboxypeptidase regulatory-like domain-containing protein [Ignavibacteria bacterium]